MGERPRSGAHLHVYLRDEAICGCRLKPAEVCEREGCEQIEQRRCMNGQLHVGVDARRN